MGEFIKGLDLSELFYKECVKQILDGHYPNLKYSAALIGDGSEILGFDTPLSTDHDWGPRMFIFLGGEDYLLLKDDISQTLSNTLPHEFYGYSTSRWTDQEITVSEDKNSLPINHMIEFYTVKFFFEIYLGINPYDKLNAIEWLTLQEHGLLGITKGRIFYDGLGELETIVSKYSYYPNDIWLYLMAAQWARISQERAFMGRSGDVGDELGSHIIASRLVKDLMRLCFLIEKQYAPYNKWYGTAFSKLKCAEELTPLLIKVMNSDNWKEREQYLSKVYTYVGKMHNNLGITKPLSTEISNYFTRPYLVINSDEFVEAILGIIEDKEVKNIKSPIGSVNQFVDSTDVLTNTELCKKVQDIYR